MKLIIVRHGETIANASQIIEGHTPGKLSDNGLEQAKKLAIRLKNEKIDYILSSDLKRAIETVEEIKKYHIKCPLIIDKNLREIYFGAWEGKSREQVGFKEGYKPDLPKNAETRQELYMRAKTLLEKIVKEYKGNNILLVTHNAFNKALVAVMTQRLPEDIKNMETYHNTAVTIFKLNNEGFWNQILHNCKKHL